MALRHVFFDVNGTLFDPSVLEEPLGEGHDGLAEELLAETVTAAMAESLSGVYRDFSELLEATAARRLQLLGREDALSAVIAKAREMPPFEGAGEAIQLLNDAGVSTGALSNSSRQAVQQLASRGGLPLSPVVGTDAVRAFKPHPEVYAAAVNAVESRPEDVTLVTAHSWDALGAKRAGCQVAWISRKEGLPLQLDGPFDLAAADLRDAASLIITHEPFADGGVGG